MLALIEVLIESAVGRVILRGIKLIRPVTLMLMIILLLSLRNDILETIALLLILKHKLLIVTSINRLRLQEFLFVSLRRLNRAHLVILVLSGPARLMK